jgi:MoxR-like ATPase
MKRAHDRIRAEIHKAIVGQEKVIEELLIALFAGGHCLLIGVPKTACASNSSKAQPPGSRY